MLDTSLTGGLYQGAAAAGDQWANLMRGSYGLGQSTGPASWQAQFLGPGALSMMGMAKQGMTAPGRDPQLQAVLKSGFGGGGGGFGGAGAGGSWDLGSTPFQVSRNLGQGFSNPLGQLQRNNQFTTGLTGQWMAPQTRLTGADLASAAMGQMTQAAGAQQAAFQSALTGASAANAAQTAAQAGAIKAIGEGAGAALSRSLTPGGYYSPSVFSSIQASAGSDMDPGGGYGGGS